MPSRHWLFLAPAVFVVLLALLVSAALAQKPVPNLPQKFVNTTLAFPPGARMVPAHDASQLTQAIKNAMQGDIIILDAGVTYTGYWKLPPTSPASGQAAEYTYIVTANFMQKHPQGKRVNPVTDAQDMAKLVTPNTAAVFEPLGGANHWRFIGLEITSSSTYIPPGSTSGNGYTYFLIGSQSHPQPLPDSIIVDRCYIHGVDPGASATGQDVVTAVQANASNYGIIDSYISAVHAPGQDTQAIGAYDSPGPFKIENNYLEAAGENIMFGGAGSNGNRGVPSDIIIRYNLLFKPLAWEPLSRPANESLVVKNAFELKSAQRVVFEFNTIQNVWSDGQAGYAIVLTVRSSQSGDFAVVNDVIIRHNSLLNVVAGINMLAADDNCGVAPYTNCMNAGSQDRWEISDNVLTFWPPSLSGGDRNLMMHISPGLDRINNKQGVPRDIVFERNTYRLIDPSAPCWNSIYFGAGSQQPPLQNLTSNIWIDNNVLCKQPTGDWGFTGLKGLTEYMGTPSPVDPRFTDNSMDDQGGACYTWPATNTCF
jgi:hypothetical protein